MVKAGGDTWYFITANYVFGQQLQRDTTTFVTGAGGKVLGSSPYPFPGTTDFSSFLLQAQASGAKVLGLANAGADTVNCIKQAHEFGLTKKMKLAGLLMFLNDVHGLGLDTAEGLVLTESFYWNMNDRTRAFTDRVKGKMAFYPNMVNAGCYSGTLHFLKTVAEMGVAEAKKDGAAVVARMKKAPTDDDCFGKASIRADGLFLTPSYLFEVKSPSQSKGPWDYYNLLVTTPANEAWEPMAEGGCKLVHA
jgi:branched-chain amino acid transport system substrate-binding protein